MRVRRMTALLLGVAVAGLVLVLPASAQDDHQDEGEPTTTIRTPQADEVGIGDGIFLTEGLIIPLDGSAERRFDAYDTAVFVQSWLPSALLDPNVLVKEPPPELPVYRVDSTGDFGGNKGTLTVYYADDGTTPYVAFPGFIVWTHPDQIPEPSNWFVPPARVIEAFNGEGKLQDTLGTQTTLTTETDGTVASNGGSDSSGSWALPALVGAGVVVIGGGLWYRRRTPADSAPD